MFRVVASGASLANSNVAPGQPVYASISSTPKHRSGKILTVGRSSKNNAPDLMFGKDGKTVSRNHLTLRLLKLGVPTPAGTPDAQEGEGGADAVGEATEEAEGNVFCKPRNPEEMAACQEAADGIILVLESTGTLGTVVEYESEADGDDGEGGEEDGKFQSWLQVIHRIVESQLHLCLYYTRLVSDFPLAFVPTIRTYNGR